MSRCGRIMIGSGADSWDPTCDMPEGHGLGACYSFSALDQHRLERRCDQCGREGQCGFSVLPTPGRIKPFVVCTNTVACRKRWPKLSDSEMDALYA